MANKATINYYAKLVQKGSYKMEEVPEELRPAIQKAYNELPPLKLREGEFEAPVEQKEEEVQETEQVATGMKISVGGSQEPLFN